MNFNQNSENFGSIADNHVQFQSQQEEKTYAVSRIFNDQRGLAYCVNASFVDLKGKNAIDYIKQFPEGSICWDLGCGDGSALLDLQQNHNSNMIPLGIGAQKFEPWKLADQNFLCHDITDIHGILNQKAEKPSIIYSGWSLTYNFMSEALMMKDCIQILAEGGVAFIADTPGRIKINTAKESSQIFTSTFTNIDEFVKKIAQYGVYIDFQPTRSIMISPGFMISSLSSFSILKESNDIPPIQAIPKLIIMDDPSINNIYSIELLIS